MQIFVKGENTLALQVDSEDTILDVKEQIEEKEGIDAEEQRLILGGQELDDELTLEDYDVEDDTTIHLVFRLAGGAKKRKKKNYTTPKKIKHKKKKVKLAVLKYYKVDENGKIHRLRRECPSETCGAGIFMAAMEDRHYCGKCGATYVYSNQ